MMDTMMEPEVGMGGTVAMWSDRHAVTVTRVISARKIVVQRDIAIRTDANGMSEIQSYRFERDTDAPLEVFTLRKNGRWIREGESVKSGRRLALGHRAAFHDYSF